MVASSNPPGIKPIFLCARIRRLTFAGYTVYRPQSFSKAPAMGQFIRKRLPSPTIRDKGVFPEEFIAPKKPIEYTL